MTASILAIGASLLTFVFVFYLLSRGILKEKYAALWLVVSGVALIFAIFPGLLRWISDVIGVKTPSNLLFFVTVVLLVLVSVQLSYELSRHEVRIRRLAEEVALLQQQMQDQPMDRGPLKARDDSQDGATGGGGSADR